MFPREDTLDDLHHERGRAFREWESYLRAPAEGRAGEGWSLERARELWERVRECDHDISMWHADNQAAEDLSLTVGYDEYLGGRP